jgi:hypothetical protein
LDPVPNVAATVADWLAVKAPVVALNVADVNPAATSTDVGTVRVELVFVSETVLPPAGAAWFSVCVVLLAPLGPKVVGLHASAVTTVGSAAAVTTPPMPATGSEFPEGSAPSAFVTLIVVLATPDAIVTPTVATTPFPITLVFKPNSRQM